MVSSQNAIGNRIHRAFDLHGSFVLFAWSISSSTRWGYLPEKSKNSSWLGVFVAWVPHNKRCCEHGELDWAVTNVTPEPRARPFREVCQGEKVVEVVEVRLLCKLNWTGFFSSLCSLKESTTYLHWLINWAFEFLSVCSCLSSHVRLGYRWGWIVENQGQPNDSIQRLHDIMFRVTHTPTKKLNSYSCRNETHELHKGLKSAQMESARIREL